MWLRSVGKTLGTRRYVDMWGVRPRTGDGPPPRMWSSSLVVKQGLTR